MFPLALTAVVLAHLVVAAPLAARAPASIDFRTPESSLTTCSNPATLSWTIRAADPVDDERIKIAPRLSRVVVASIDGKIKRTIVENPAQRSFIWESVDVSPGQYILTGAVAGRDQDFVIHPSDEFNVLAGDSLDCVPAADLAAVDPPVPSSATESTSSATQPTPQHEQSLPSEVSEPTVVSTVQTQSGVSVGVAAGIATGVIVLLVAAFAFWWRCRYNRSRELVDVEYVYPPPRHTQTTGSIDSSQTVVEVRARSPTPVNVLGLTLKQQTASDLDLNQTQKMLRRL